ncbi:MAG: hypothetical protein D6794_02190 [Deltaproteobacteria bacterium]|nr:MAG: hypothetical protein D6794_02190 [Deltaproteobacteria bacterium]
MMIPVVYADGRHDMVKPRVLDQLIAEKKIVRFRRASGWVDIETDPVRRANRQMYSIPERRQSLQ